MINMARVFLWFAALTVFYIATIQFSEVLSLIAIGVVLSERRLTSRISELEKRLGSDDEATD